MKKAIIIVLLITQANSMSFYDVFAPVEDSLGRLVTDVVSSIKETIDCTILAVERVFTLGGFFGGPSDYDQRCKGQTADNNVANYNTQTNNDTPDAPEVKAPKVTAKQAIIEDVESVSDASLSIQVNLNQSSVNSKKEKDQNSIKNQSERLNQINALLRHNLEKLPEKVRNKLNFNPNKSNKLEDIFNEIKLLYEVEQKDKSSAEANEVRHVFDKVLVILRCTGINSSLSDEDEVKLILKLLGKSSNDVKKQVTMWSDEENKEIKNIIIITNATQARTNTSDDEDKTKEKLLLTEKLDEMETQQARMADFYHSLKNFTKNIANEVGSISSPKPSNEQYTTESLVSSHTLKKHDNVLVSAQKDEHSDHPTTEAPTFTEINSVSTESSTITENNTTEFSITTERNSVSTESSVTIESSNEKDFLTYTTTEITSVTETEPDSAKSPQIKDFPAPITTELLTTSEVKYVSESTTKNLNSDFTESPIPINENVFTAAAQLTSPTTTTAEPSDQEIVSTTQLPLTIKQRTAELKQLLQSNSQTNTTSTQMSSNKTLSSVQPSQTGSHSIHTVQSNIKTFTTAAKLPAPNAQANATQARTNTSCDEDKTKENRLLTEKLDEMETQQAGMADFSHSLKFFTKNILNEVGSISSPKPSNEQYTTESPVSSHTLKKHEKDEHSDHPTIEAPTFTEINSVSTESSTITENNTTEFAITTERNSVSTESSVTIETSNEKDFLTYTTTEITSLMETEPDSAKSPQRMDFPAPITTELSTKSEIKYVSESTTKNLNSDFTESPTAINENVFTAAAQLTSPITTTAGSSNQENVSTTQLPLTVKQCTAELKQLLQSNSQTNATSTQMSSNMIKALSSVQSSQTGSHSIQTVQSNIQTVTTAAKLPAPAQKLEAVSGDNSATPNTPRADLQKYSSSTQPTQIANQPDTATDLPKSFKELAKKLFTNNNPPEIQEHDYSYPDSAAEGGTKDSLSALKSLFAAQDPASQQAAVESAKKLIEESKMTTAFLNKLFQKYDRSSAPSVFDDY